MPTEYPANFKKEVINRYQNGESIKSLSHELHITQGTLYRWRKEYCSIQGINRTYTPKEFDAISRRLTKLEHEMEIICLSQCITSVPLQKRLSILENLYHQADNTYSVHELCEALDVARGTFYNHIFRRADRSQRDQEQAQLIRLVQQAFDDIGQRYGAEKIRITLAEGGIRVSTKRIAAIIQDLDLHSIRLDSKNNLRSIRNTASKTCWSSNLPQIGLIKHGSVILHTSRSTITGFICASFSTSFPEGSSAIAFPATPAQIWSPAHFGQLSANEATPLI